MSYDNLINTQLGQYELIERLGKGGMGAVYRASQVNLNRDVAVKVLSEDLADNPHFVERFRREAKTAAGLEHSHIVPVYDYGNVEDITYVVMRLLEGGSLADRLREALKKNSGLPELYEVTRLLDHISGALDYAHRLGVIHRDIKPSNIMYDGVGNVFIVDFGIAKLTDSKSQLTAAGMMMGTPTYMAPEQWRTEEVTAATDQYAVGVMMYQILVGQPPFETPAPYGLMHKHIHEEPTPPHELRSDLSQAVSDVLSRAMAKRQKDRFPSMAAFSEVFRQAIEHGSFASTHLPTPQSVVNRTPAKPTQPQQIKPKTPPPAPPPLQAQPMSQTPNQRNPWDMPVTSQPSTPYPATPQSLTRDKKSNTILYIGLIGVILAIVAIVVSVLVIGGDDGGSDEVQVSPIESAERYLSALVAEDVNEARDYACRRIFDETDIIINSFSESGGVSSLEDLVCEEDGSEIVCTFRLDSREQSTSFTVDNDNKVCGGELIEMAGGIDDPSAEESSRR